VQDTQAFAPFYKVSRNGTQTGTLMPSITVAATAGGANPSGVIPAANSGGSAIQIANTATSWAYVNFGAIRDAQTVTAATVAASYPVAPGAMVVVSVDPEVNGASVILASGTGNVIFTRGNGV
jgi:hypothetical protein